MLSGGWSSVNLPSPAGKKLESSVYEGWHLRRLYLLGRAFCYLVRLSNRDESFSRTGAGLQVLISLKFLPELRPEEKRALLSNC